VKIEWKHKKAESQVEPLLSRAARLDPELTREFPRSVEAVLAAAMPVSFERYAGLRMRTVVDILGDSYSIDARALLEDGDSALAGYTFARGQTAVVFSDSQYGEDFERFTRAHEASHLAVEYLPVLDRARQPQLFGGQPVPEIFARRDPPDHIFMGAESDTNSGGSGDPSNLRRDPKAWLREVIANACAAELLAPYREVGHVAAGLPPGSDLVEAIRRRFGLSRSAAKVRASDLGLLDGAASEHLFPK
jgi:hypothetical protein